MKNEAQKQIDSRFDFFKTEQNLEKNKDVQSGLNSFLNTVSQEISHNLMFFGLLPYIAFLMIATSGLMTPEFKNIILDYCLKSKYLNEEQKTLNHHYYYSLKILKSLHN